MLWNWLWFGFRLWICYKIGFGLDLNFGYIMKVVLDLFWIWIIIQDIYEIVIDLNHICLKHVYELLNGICFMYTLSMVMGGSLTWFSTLCFLLDLNEDYEPKGHGWYGTTMVSLVNRLIAKSVQGLKWKWEFLKRTWYGIGITKLVQMTTS